MEDYILRKIDKIGVIIAAIMSGFRVRKQIDDEDCCSYAMTELLDKLDVDLDTLLGQDDIVKELGEQHGFSNDNLDHFAELLYELVLTASDQQFIDRCIVSIGRIYRYLYIIERSASFKRYYILKDLERFSN